MGDTTEHRELGVFAKAKPFAHPREEVRQAIMSSLDALRDTRAPARERQGPHAVGTQNDIGILLGERRLLGQHVGAIYPGAPYDLATGK